MDRLIRKGSLLLLKGVPNLQLDKKHCPICGEENHCMAGTNEQYQCWCMKENIPKEVLELVPKELKGKYCICQNCIGKYRE